MEIDSFLPGSASLVEMVDKRLFLSLRDGRYLYGILRSYDQFANLVLQDTVERIFLPKTKEFGDIAHGVYLVRGENVVLVGECAMADQDPVPVNYELFKGEEGELVKMWNLERGERKRREAERNAKLYKLGFSTEIVDGDLY